MSRIIRGTAIGNGMGGFYARGDVEMIDCFAGYNGGPGFDVADASLMEFLGLPNNTDPKLLFDWLSTLQSTQVDQREDLVKSSGFWERAGKVAPPLSIASSLLNIVNSPLLFEILRRLG